MLFVPFKSEPRWKWVLARIFGKTIHREGGIVSKRWRGFTWIYYKGRDNGKTLREDTNKYLTKQFIAPLSDLPANECLKEAKYILSLVVERVKGIENPFLKLHNTSTDGDECVPFAIMSDGVLTPYSQMPQEQVWDIAIQAVLKEIE